MATENSGFVSLMRLLPQRQQSCRRDNILAYHAAFLCGMFGAMDISDTTAAAMSEDYQQFLIERQELLNVISTDQYYSITIDSDTY